jgi:hypothetical protein
LKGLVEFLYFYQALEKTLPDHYYNLLGMGLRYPFDLLYSFGYIAYFVFLQPLELVGRLLPYW